MDEFVVAGITYRATKMNAMTQFHVARRLSPVLVRMPDITQAAAESDKDPGPPQFARVLCAMSADVAKDDIDAATNTCLATVTRQSGAAFAQVSGAGGQMMFDDIGLREMLEIVWHVLRINRLLDFFGDAPSPEKGGVKSAV